MILKPRASTSGYVAGRFSHKVVSVSCRNTETPRGRRIEGPTVRRSASSLRCSDRLCVLAPGDRWAQVELWYLGHRPRVDRERLLQSAGRDEGVAEIVKVPNRGHSPMIDSGWREVADTGLAFVPNHGSMP